MEYLSNLARFIIAGKFLPRENIMAEVFSVANDTPKTTKAAGIAGAIATAIAWAMSQFFGIDMAAGIEGAIATVAATMLAWFRKE